MSVNCQQSSSCPIPSRFGNSKDWPLLPDSYSQTPEGTFFSTTPGGTKIIYDRKFLLECRNSPIARTPPCCLPHIPGVTVPPLGKLSEGMENSPHLAADDDQFMIDI
ncbi:eukaryotic translation initiation factor 4E-binding protein 3 isoform X1 [Osmerus eperlanus]|uniref:eukaryotic translation initiation factor 4E-binding protein 3 isoform X1 n=1 Tax=Osmerus eperlanus TaxID=29151 RepID=UPI002E13406E